MTEIAHKRRAEEGTRHREARERFVYRASQMRGPTLAFFGNMSQPDIPREQSGPIPHDAPDPTGTWARMRQAISAASIGAGSHEELDSAAREFVHELRGANAPPEQVVLAIKRVLAQAGLRPSHQPMDPAMIVERHATVYRSVIASTIRHYFDGADGAQLKS